MSFFFEGHGCLEAVLLFFFHCLVRKGSVEAQVKFWFQGHGSLNAAPLCHGNGSLGEKFQKLEILPRGCLQEIMTRFVHRGPCEKIVQGRLYILEEVEPMYILLSNVCKRRVCGGPGEVRVPRT